jgi:N-methylhydantoinase A
MRAGIEIGGTFTDLVLLREDGSVVTQKVPSTPEDPSIGALEGLSRLLGAAGVHLGDLDELFHGSTIATNTLLERKGARCVLLTTAGFEDVLLIGRQDKTRVYDMFYRKPAPLIERGCIFGLEERLDGLGEVVTKLSTVEIDRVLDRVAALPGIESAAVMLLHAYRNPVHELAVKERWQARFPDIPVSLSSEIAPEFREYERASTTAIAAYVRPRVASYLENLSDQLCRMGFAGRFLVMQSNGGVAPVAAAQANPAKMFLSGPAAGVTGAAHVARQLGFPNLLTIDIGGTSCDACLLVDRVPQKTQRGYAEYKIDGLPISLMMVDIVTLGAGGGSIAWIDDGGILQVGPRSAGAAPGPACYGRGGTEFTVSDALLVLGMMDPDSFAGGQMRLDPAAARRAGAQLAEKLGQDLATTAESVLRIMIANIARALRLVTVQRGYDPRDFALFAYGGAGPAFAAAIAEEMDLESVIVPRAPGTFSALGLSVADTQMDYVRSVPGTRLSRVEAGVALDAFASMMAQADSDFIRFGFAPADLVFQHSVDARYVGQGYELSIPVDLEAMGRDGFAALIAAFHQAHANRYGLRFDRQEVELIGCRTVAIRPNRVSEVRGEETVERSGRTTTIRFGGRSYEAPVMARGALGRALLEGPALLTEASSTTVTPPGWQAEMVETGEILLRRAARKEVG